MTRLIDVLTDEERAVRNRISVLKEREKELMTIVCLLDLKIKGMKSDVIKKVIDKPYDYYSQKRILERELQKPKKDKVSSFDWATRTTYL